MIAVALPEPGAVLLEELEGRHPLGALPGVEPGHDEAGGAAVFEGERLAVMVGGDEGILGEEHVEREVGGPAVVVAMDDT